MSPAPQGMGVEMNGAVLGGLVLVAAPLVMARASEGGGSPASAGGGEAGVSGYTVSEVGYDLADDGLVSAVGFRLDGQAGVVVARVNDEPAKCRPTGERTWRCELAGAGVAVASIERLGVVASQR